MLLILVDEQERDLYSLANFMMLQAGVIEDANQNQTCPSAVSHSHCLLFASQPPSREAS